MADIKQLEIIPDSGPLGTKIVNFGDAPGGLSTDRKHISPRHPRRTQDGTLVTQTVSYNKKEITISGVIWDITLHTYLEALFESGIGATLKLWYENASYAETAEFNAPVSFLDYNDVKDQNNNSRAITAEFAEV
jgi:hypothetical protein